MKKIFIVLSVLILIGCSSSAKNKGDIDNIRKMAELELDMGNKAAGQGKFQDARFLLTEAKRKAVSVDDASLIIRTSLSLGNVLLSLDNPPDAFSQWDHAISESQRIGNAELLSASRIFRARGVLLTELAASGAGDAGLKQTAQSVLDLVIKEQPNISIRYYTAFSWQLRGLALRVLGSYTEAENAVKRSLEIHEKDKYLENASFDWYIIASVRSLNQNYSGALLALESSIEIDRRIENSYGLASSWKAMGDVLNKAGRAQEAEQAYARADAILQAAQVPPFKDGQNAR